MKICPLSKTQWTIYISIFFLTISLCLVGIDFFLLKAAIPLETRHHLGAFLGELLSGMGLGLIVFLMIVKRPIEPAKGE
jgi:hypothetical protein